VLFNSDPVECRSDGIVLDVSETQQTIPNDFVWVYAGGEPPAAFLKKIGLGFGERDLTKKG
jgi:thioredoxin reductase